MQLPVALEGRAVTAEVFPWIGYPLTLAEYRAMPENEFRNEVVEGILSIMARPPVRHQAAVLDLAGRVDEQLPKAYEALPRVDVVLNEVPLTVRVPDVLVTWSALITPDEDWLRAADVVLVVEILSDGTRKVDQILKFAEYAEAGIPRYWIVDLDPPASLRAFALVDGNYERSGEFTGPVELAVDGHPVTVDPATLARR